MEELRAFEDRHDRAAPRIISLVSDMNLMWDSPRIAYGRLGAIPYLAVTASLRDQINPEGSNLVVCNEHQVNAMASQMVVRQAIERLSPSKESAALNAVILDTEEPATSVREKNAASELGVSVRTVQRNRGSLLQNAAEQIITMEIATLHFRIENLLDKHKGDSLGNGT